MKPLANIIRLPQKDIWRVWDWSWDSKESMWGIKNQRRFWPYLCGQFSNLFRPRQVRHALESVSGLDSETRRPVGFIWKEKASRIRTTRRSNVPYGFPGGQRPHSPSVNQAELVSFKSWAYRRLRRQSSKWWQLPLKIHRELRIGAFVGEWMPAAS